MDAERLKTSPLFEGIADDDLARIAELFQESEMLAGSSLAKQDDFSYKFFVVLDGEVDVARDFEIIATIGEGDFFGEMGLVQHERRNARVTARTRCHLAWMMGWDFQAMTSDFPEIAARIDAKIAERMSSVPDGDSDAEEE